MYKIKCQTESLSKNNHYLFFCKLEQNIVKAKVSIGKRWVFTNLPECKVDDLFLRSTFSSSPPPRPVDKLLSTGHQK